MPIHPTSVILHDIRSSENVGSIFRTADASGVSKIYLTGYTPSPIDRFKRKNPKLAKASLGAENFVPWALEKNIFQLIQTLKDSGAHVVAVEQSPKAVSYMIQKRTGNTTFIFGNEVDGLSEEILQAADTIVEIPMHGQKESLNVAVAVGIILYGRLQ